MLDVPSAKKHIAQIMQQVEKPHNEHDWNYNFRKFHEDLLKMQQAFAQELLDERDKKNIELKDSHVEVRKGDDLYREQITAIFQAHTMLQAAVSASDKNKDIYPALSKALDSLRAIDEKVHSSPV